MIRYDDRTCTWFEVEETSYDDYYEDEYDDEWDSVWAYDSEFDDDLPSEDEAALWTENMDVHPDGTLNELPF